MDEMRKHIENIKKEYEDNLRGKGEDSVEASHWIGKEKTWLRFKILCSIDDLSNKKILDFGCGNALLLDYLKEHNINCNYYGWDISKEMIRIAKDRYPNIPFKQIDMIEDMIEYYNFFDYILISGVFYIKGDSDNNIHREFIYQTLKHVWQFTTKGISVNFLTEHVDWFDKKLYYCQIGDITSFISKNLSRRFVVRHDYPLWEFTIFVYK